jgi:hypothetical protein
MPCEHVGAPELIEMAEEHLRSRGVPQIEWPGSKFRYTENIADGMWVSVCVEIERRGDQWVVTRVDRSRQPAPEAETGFKVL